MIPYWKPEPKKPSRDLAYHALLWPAALYSLGVIIYSAMALVPNGHITNAHRIGSALMVIGGELGTLPTAIEVFRKRRADEARKSDNWALVVSLLATLGNLFVVYTSFSELTVGWVEFVCSYGPLTLLLFSGLDFYANALELGHYKASFAERWEKWNDGRHTYEQTQRTRALNLAQPAQEDDNLEPRPANELTPSARRARLLALWRATPGATQDELAQEFGVSRQTISGDFAVLAKAGKVQRNGNGVEVLV